MTFTGDETNEPLRVDVTPDTCPGASDGRYLIAPFTLDAFAVDRGDARVSTFQTPVQLTMNLTLDQLAPYFPDSLGLYYHNPTTDSWDPVSADVDFYAGTIHAELSHFSEYAASAEPAVILPRALEQFDVAEQQGAAIASVPIELPHGPGGIGPDLSLTYSSAVVDEMKTSKSQASWVGAGWNLAVPSISRDPFTHRYYLGGVPGSSGLIIRENSALSSCPSGFSGTCFEWHAKTDQYLKIISMRCGNDGTADVYNIFHVWTKDGTLYEFGTVPGVTPACTTADPSSTGYPTSLQSFAVYWASPAGWHQYHYRMDIDRITDTSGNNIDFSYIRDLRCYFWPDSNCTNWTVRAAYPLQITWNGFKVIFTSSGTWDVGGQCDNLDPNTNGGLVRKDSPVDDGVPAGGSTCPPTGTCANHYMPSVMETRQLDSIQVQTSAGLHIREYDLDHSQTSTSRYGCNNGAPISGNLALDNIYIKGAGSSPDTLRTIHMAYELDSLRYRQNDASPYTDCPAPAFSRTVTRPYLSTVSNGLGATTSYSYYKNPAVWGAPYQATCGWERMIVQQRTVAPGGGQASEVYAYTYVSPTYWADNGVSVAIVDAEFRGFGQVTEENKTSGGTVLSSRVCGYHTDSYLVGLTDSCQIQDSGGATLESQTYTWSTTDTCSSSCNLWDPASDEFQVSKFASLNRVTDSMTGRDTLTTEYLYDSYGNGSAICEYSGNHGGSYCSTGSTRLRLTQIYYTSSALPSPTSSTYIVDAVQRRDIQKDDSSFVGSTQYFYDGSGTQGAIPTRPLVTEVRNWTSGSTYIKTKAYSYNGNGSLNTEKTYQTDATYGENDYHYTTCGGATVSSIDDVGTGLTTFTTAFTYGEGGNSYGCLFQKPVTIQDWNNQVTSNTYDAFGRTTEVWKPGDTCCSGTPTITYTYQLNVAIDTGGGPGSGIGNLTNTYRKDGTSSTMWSAEWTDGLGRVIQTRREGIPDEGGNTIVVAFAYNAAGNRISESQPYTSTQGGSYQPAVFTYLTSYDYDALNRVIKVTDPDTADGHRDTTYSGTQRTELDELLNRTVYTQDALGRTVTVAEYTDGTNHRDAVYTFDQIDLVTAVNYDGVSGDEISYGYDGLGRKTSDMNAAYSTSASSFAYCNDGSLRRSTDPRGVSITYAYDLRGRQTGRQYGASVDTCATAITPTIQYTYDTNPNTMTHGQNISAGFYSGRLTQVTDAVGEHIYSYDLRGRPAYERTVTDVSSPCNSTHCYTYNVIRTYDSMDRLATLRYPSSNTTYPSDSNGEQITYTYDVQGNISKMQTSLGGYYLGSSSTSATWTVTDQPSSLPLGNATTTSYSYYPADKRLNTIGAGGSPALNLTYSYDGAGNASETVDGNLTFGTTDWGYNGRNQLTGSINSTPQFNDVYDYDARGRLKTKTTDQTHLASFTSLCYNAACDGQGTSYRLLKANGINFRDPRVANDPFQYNLTYDARGDIVEINSGASNANMGLLTRFRYSIDGGSWYDQAADGYDAEGRLQWISYDKLNYGDFEMNQNPTTNTANMSQCLVNGQDTGKYGGIYGSYNHTVAQGPFGPPSNLLPGSLFDLNMDGTINGQDYGKIGGVIGVNNRTCRKFLYNNDGSLGRITGGDNLTAMLLIGDIYERRDDGTVVTYYYAGGLRIGMRQVGGTASPGMYYLAQNGVGSTVHVVDGASGGAGNISYTPFGQIASVDSAIAISFRLDRLFAGYMAIGLPPTFDNKLSGIYYAGARFYSAELGRFLSPDPVGPNPMNPASFDPYAYVQNNPLTFADPSGASIACPGGCYRESMRPLPPPTPGPIIASVPQDAMQFDSVIPVHGECTNSLSCGLSGGWTGGSCSPGGPSESMPGPADAPICTATFDGKFAIRVTGERRIIGDQNQLIVGLRVCAGALGPCRKPGFTRNNETDLAGFSVTQPRVTAYGRFGERQGADLERGSVNDLDYDWWATMDLDYPPDAAQLNFVVHAGSGVYRAVHYDFNLRESLLGPYNGY